MQFGDLRESPSEKVPLGTRGQPVFTQTSLTSLFRAPGALSEDGQLQGEDCAPGLAFSVPVSTKRDFPLNLFLLKQSYSRG